MRQTKHKLSYGFIILFLMILQTACSAPEESESAIEEKTIPVRGQQVNPVSREQRKSFTGSLEGEKQAIIIAKIAEAVERIDVVEGDEVKENTVIIRLDNTGPTSNYLQSKSIFLNAEKNFKKMEYLFSEGAISETQFDGSQTEYEVARANYSAARQLVELKTPIAGTVTSIDVSTGDYVSPGQPVATVATVSRLRMKLGVNSTDIGYFSIGDTVSVLVEAMAGFEAVGTVAMVAGSADPETRTFQVEIAIDNSKYLFKPGMFARADIIVESFDNILVAPQTAVLTRNNKAFLFLASNGRAFAREVILGAEFSGLIEIRSGLNSGDTIITLGQDYLTDSCLIKLTELTITSGEEMEL